MARQLLLQQSWTQVAAGYQEHLVPRFAPWTRQTLQALDAAGALPPGAVLVPACGPGQELPLLATRLPQRNRPIVGVDLAEGMVELASEAIAESGLGQEGVRAVVGDATAVDPALLPLACVFSCFGLQQMPEPAQVLAAWTRALAPGGVLAICYWPREVEGEGPWRRLADLTTAGGKPQVDWEADIPAAAVREGAEVLEDSRPSHTMSWPSANAFWEGMVRAGPWHSRLLQHGEEAMEGVRRAFMAGVADTAAPLVHAPTARLIVLRRLAAAL